MGNSKIVIELVAKDQASKEFIGASQKIKGTLKDIELSGKKSLDLVTGSVKSFKTALSGITAITGGYGLMKLAEHAVNTASSFEQMEIKLNVLTKGRGKQTLEEINAWAMEMPVNTQKAIDTFVMMKAMGLDPVIESLGGVIQAMEILVDVGSIFGQEAMPRVARALGQMVSLGKLSAEELNQLSEAGINARKYLTEAFGKTVEELQKSGISIQKIVLAIAEGMKKEFGGSARASMNSWKGVTTEFASIWTEIEREFMAAGVFTAMKEQIKDVSVSMREWLEDNRELIRQKVPEYCEKIAASLRILIDAFGSVTLAVGGFVAEIDRMSKNPLVMGLWGAAAGSRLGPVGAVVGGVSAGLMGTYNRYSNVLEEYREKEMKREAEVTDLFTNPPSVAKIVKNVPVDAAETTPATPATKPPSGGGGGGGARGATSRTNPEEELAHITERLSEGSLQRRETIDKEYQEWIAKIAEVGASYDSTNQAMVLAARWRQEQVDKFNTESLQKSVSILDELLKSSNITEEERTRYATQYSENRTVLIKKELDELRKLAIPEDVLKSYQRLQEEKLKTYVLDTQYQTENMTKASSVLESVLASEKLSQVQRTNYAQQYSEIRMRLIEQEVEGLRKLAIPEDVLESYRRLQEEAVKTQTESMKMSETMREFMEETFTQMSRNIQSGIADALKTLRSDTESFGDFLVNLEETILSILDQLAAKAITDWAAQYMSIQSAIQGFSSGSGILDKIGGFFSGLVGSFFGGGGGGTSSASTGFSLGGYFPYAKGGVIPGHFQPLPIRAFQYGGIADYPTLGLIAEAGRSEAVLPLTRTSGGDLGVKAIGVQEKRQINVNVHIHAQDAQSFFRSRGQIKKEIGQTMRQISREM